MTTKCFSEAEIEAVWRKGRVDTFNDPGVWRKDACYAWMHRGEYGNRQSSFGWEIDHINPNGGDGLANLQPLQWQNNCYKADGPMRCYVTAVGVGNGRVTAR